MNDANRKPPLLIIEDNELFAEALSEYLQSNGYTVYVATTGAMAEKLLKGQHYPIWIVDQSLPDASGLDFIRHTTREDSVVIVMSAYASVAYAVEAIQAGAFDYLPKPFELEELGIKVEKAYKHYKLSQIASVAGHVLEKIARNNSFIGDSPAALKTKKEIETLGRFGEVNVLIQGETGVGKEVVARAIHNAGPHPDGPFIAINCAAVSPGTMDSVLFGHRKGAFTGAIEDRRGAFSLAAEGTLFLDELTEMPIELQAKLLRAVETRTYFSLGGERELTFTGRILASTNREVREAIAEKKLRQDLHYRLSSAQELTLLRAYNWPGNVRELKNLTTRSVMLGDYPLLSKYLFPSAPQLNEAEALLRPPTTPPGPLEEVVQRHVEGVLRHTGGNKAKAARILGISLSTLQRKLKRWQR